MFVCTSCTVCLKATVQVCTACMFVSLLTTCVNFNSPPLTQIAHFDAIFASQTRKKARLPTQKAFKLQSVETTTTARVQTQLGSEKASALSPSSSRGIGLLIRLLIGLKKLFAKWSDQSVFAKFRIAGCSCMLLALALSTHTHEPHPLQRHTQTPNTHTPQTLQPHTQTTKISNSNFIFSMKNSI